MNADIRIVCVEDGRTIATNKTECWEYWSFSKECCSFDQHATEVTQAIGLMVRGAHQLDSVEVQLECQCYRMELTVTATMYVGAATPSEGGNVQPLEDDCGTFGMPAAPEGQTATSTWTFPGAGPDDTDAMGPNAFEGTPVHRVTFEPETKRSVTHNAVFFSGDCPDDSAALHPEVKGYE